MIVVYDSEGRISYTVDEPYPAVIEDTYDELALSDPDFNYLTTAQGQIGLQYVNLDSTPTIEDRPEMELSYPSSISVGDEISIVGVPPNATVYADGSDIHSTGSIMETVDVEAIDPGSYYFYIEAWPYLPVEFTVSVLA